MITNSPPSRSSSRSVLVVIARPARAPPRASEPVSPMGDTGSLALGGALAGLAITTRTDLLLLLLGGLFVIITMSVVIQVGSFKLTHKRVFRMAPLQHHFELAGWAETTIVVRFWLIAGMFVALGLGIFYVGWFPR